MPGAASWAGVADAEDVEAEGVGAGDGELGSDVVDDGDPDGELLGGPEAESWVVDGDADGAEDRQPGDGVPRSVPVGVAVAVPVGMAVAVPVGIAALPASGLVAARW